MEAYETIPAARNAREPVMKKWIPLLAAVVFSALNVAVIAEPLDEGLAALNAGKPERALELWKPLAEKGDFNAQFYMGQLYREGKGVPPDPREAARWFQKAADQGQASAQNNLAYFYATGLGVPKSDEIAYKWLVLAAAGGHADAKRNIELFASRLTPEALAETEARLGWMYQTGWKVTRQDSKEAAHWYLSAALRGHAVAQNNIADMYARGEGVDFNLAEAYRWYAASAMQGHYPAQFNLAMLFFKGHGVAQDFAQAYAWLHLVIQAAAKEGETTVSANTGGEARKQIYLLEQQMTAADRLRATNGIGVLYHQGLGVKQNYAEARSWYQRAADGGYASGFYNLGLLHQDGLGVEKNTATAAEWFRQAAELGHAAAQNNYGVLLQQGISGKQDPTAALEWFRKAANQGYLNAQTNLGAAYYSGNGIERDYTQAMSWFRKAADSGYPRALEMVGRMTFLGQGAKADAKEAYKWFWLAQSLGYEPAKTGMDLVGAKLKESERAAATKAAEQFRAERIRALSEGVAPAR